MGNDLVQTVTLSLQIRNAASAEAIKFIAQLKAMGAAAKSVDNSVASALSSPLAGALSAAGVVEGIKKALDLAKQSQLIQDQLSVALGGNVQHLHEVDDLTASIASKTYFSADQLGNATERLLERGVKLKDIPQSLQVVADVAAALHLPLNDAADAIAQTFGGTVPKSLGRAVPALHGLTKEALESGAALDLLSKKFNGKAAEEALTPSGKAIAATRDIEEAWKDIGLAILPIEKSMMPAIAKQFQALVEPFKADTIIGWGNVLKEVVAQIAGDAVFPADFLRSLITDDEIFLEQTLELADQNIRLRFINLLKFISTEFKDQIKEVAQAIDNVTAHSPGWLGGKTNLAGSVDATLNTAALDKAAATAHAAAQTAADKIAGNSAGVLQRAFDAANQGRDDTIAATEQSLGAGAGEPERLAAQQAEQKRQEAASAAKQRIKDAEDEKDALESILNVRKELDQEKGPTDTSTELDQLKTQFDEKSITLEQYFARRKALETQADDQEISGIEKQIVALGIKAAKEKLAGEPATDSLTEIHDLMVKLLPLEDQRAAKVAKIADDEQRALKARQAENDSADKERIKSTQELISGLTENAKRGIGEVNDGSQTPEEFKASLDAQVADIAASMPATFAAVDGLVRDSIFSPADGEILKARFDSTFSEALTRANAAAKAVTPLVADLNAVGDAARKTATSGLANALTEIETGSKNASQAFGDMAKNIIKSVLDIINQRLAERLADALLGPDSGKGGSPINGGALGGLGQLLFGKSSTGGTPGPTTQPSDGSGGAGGGLFGGVSFGINNVLDASGKAIGNVASGAGQLIGNVASGVGNIASGVASEAGSAVDWVEGLLGILGSFSTGGYTGDGHPSTPAGIVHKGEFVVPQHRVKAIGLDELHAMNAGNVRISTSGGTRSPNISGIVASINSNGGMGGDGGGREVVRGLSRIENAVSDLADANARQKLVGVPMGETQIRDFINHPSTPASLARMMVQNPGVMGPAIQKLQR